MNERAEPARPKPGNASEEAADWLLRQDRGALREHESIAFEEWLTHPENARAYRRAKRAWASLEGAEADPTLNALRQAALEITPPKRASLARAGVIIGALAATCAALVVGLVWFQKQDASHLASLASAEDYRTRVGEQRVIHLADGSKVTLDTASEIDTALSPTERLIYLRRGRALFEVAHDAQRPFLVQAADHRARALGTSFDVRVADGRLDILLVEGSLQVDRLSNTAGTAATGASVRLKPGERFSAPVGAPGQVATAVNVERELLWREGFVEFDDQRLDVALAEMNRYADSSVVIRDPEVAALRISGIFRTRQMQRFLEVVSGVLPVEVRHESEQSAEIVPAGAP